MATYTKRQQYGIGWILSSGQYSDDGLTSKYEIGSTGTYLQYNGIGRAGIRFETGSAGLGTSVKSVLVKGRKYGLPSGNITVNIRKASDDTVAATIGTFPIEAFPSNTEQSFALRLRANTYNMVANDIVSVEYPSNAVNGFEIANNNVVSDPSGYTSRSHNGSVWSSALTDPLAVVIKT